MAIKKIAIAEDILPEIIPFERLADKPKVAERFEQVVRQAKSFQKQAKGRAISPKMDDFLYASCVMMHAAEAALVDQETGNLLEDAQGNRITGKFEKFTDHKGKESLKWTCSSPDIMPYRNGNGDIFPEKDLKKAYKEWVGKPLCRDHVSNTVDGIRGIIIDTYYDEKFKRVHALFALDRKNYGDLARKVEAGYATAVSMGTAVGRSICTDCGNVATTEAEYCSHVRNKNCYGEINEDLSPIELSIVVTGADPQAKIKTVLAHLNQYEEQVEQMKQTGGVNYGVLADLEDTIGNIKDDLIDNKQVKVAEDNVNEKATVLLRLLGNTDESDKLFDEARTLTRQFINNHHQELEKLSDTNLDKLIGVLNHLNLQEEKGVLLPFAFDRTREFLKETGDVQVGREDRSPDLVDTEGFSLKSDTDLSMEKDYVGRPGEPTSGAPQNFASLYISDLYKTTNDVSNLYTIERKVASLANQINSLQKELNKEKPMTFDELRKKALERKSYYQGTEDPSEVLPYPLMGDQEKIRDTQDKQVVGDELDTSADNPDLDEKKMLQRAELEERAARRAALVAQIKEGNVVPVETQDGKTKALNTDTGQFAAADGKKSDKKDDDEDDKEDDKKDKDDDKDDKKKDKKEDDDKDDKKKDKDDKDDDDKKDKDDKKEKKAFYQGTEEPRPGQQQYPLMGDQDGLRLNQDRQMLQTGPLGGDSGTVPGDENLKKDLQRVANRKLSATFYKQADPSKSRWDFFAGKEKVLSVVANAVYGEDLTKKAANGKTYSEFFHSKPYGAQVMKMIRAQGPAGAADEMGLEAEPPMAEAPDMPPEAPELPELPGEEDMGGEDKDMRDAINTGIEKLEVALEELRSAVSEEEGVADLEVSLEEPGASPAGMEGDLGGPDALPEPVASVSDGDMLEAYAFLTDIVNELSYIDTRFAESKDKGLVSLAKSAVSDANEALGKVSKMVRAYKLNKALQKTAQGMNNMMGQEQLANDYNRETEEMYTLDEELNAVHELVEDEAKEEVEKHELEMHKDEANAYDNMYVQDANISTEASLKNFLAQRKAWRKGLIAEAGKYDDVYEGEHGGPGPKLENLGLSVSDDGDKFENLHETHQAMEDVATKDPGGPKVREAAKKLDKAIKAGIINANKLEELVALGAADPEAVNFWKTYYGQVDGGNEFAQGLVAEFSKSASQDNEEAKIVRYKRAMMLGMEAADKGIISRGRASLNDFVDNMVNLPDDAFNSWKRMVEQTKGQVKGAIPQVRGPSSDELVSEAKLRQDNTAPTVENLGKAFLEGIKL